MTIAKAMIHQKSWVISSVGSVQKSPSSKAAVIFARGTYWHYVSMEKGGEHRWRLFSTDPETKIRTTQQTVAPLKEKTF